MPTAQPTGAEPVTPPRRRYEAVYLYSRDASQPGGVRVSHVSGDVIPVNNNPRCAGCNHRRHPTAMHTCGRCRECCRCRVCTTCTRTVERACDNCGGCLTGRCCRCIRCQWCGTAHATTDRICSFCGAGRGGPCRCCTDNRNGLVHYVKRPVDLLRFAVKQDQGHLLRTNRSPRLIANEIETAGGENGDYINQALLKWNCSVVRDGSVSGFEINSHPAGGDLYLELIGDLCGAMAQQNVTVDQRCGCHTHVDARDLRYYEIIKLMMVYGAIENGLFSICPMPRRSNNFCVACGITYMGKAMTAINGIDRAQKNKQWAREAVLDAVYGDKAANTKPLKATKGHQNRYRAMNLHSWVYRGSVEYRLPPGSVSKDTITGWGMFFAGMMDTVTQMSITDINLLTKPMQDLIAKYGADKLKQEYGNIPKDVQDVSWDILRSVAPKSVEGWLENREGLYRNGTGRQKEVE